MSDWAASASLVLATFDLLAVRAVTDAMRANRCCEPVSGIGPAPNCDRYERRFRIHPEPKYEPRPVIHPTPRYEERTVLYTVHWKPTIEVEQNCLAPLPPVVETVGPSHPIEAPFRPVWEQPLPVEAEAPVRHPPPRVAAVRSVSRKGLIVDLHV